MSSIQIHWILKLNCTGHTLRVGASGGSDSLRVTAGDAGPCSTAHLKLVNSRTNQLRAPVSACVALSDRGLACMACSTPVAATKAAGTGAPGGGWGPLAHANHRRLHVCASTQRISAAFMYPVYPHVSTKYVASHPGSVLLCCPASCGPQIAGKITSYAWW